MHALTR